MTTDNTPRMPRLIGKRVRVAGRSGEIVTFRMAASGWRYGVALDDGPVLPEIGEESFDHTLGE